MQQSCVLWLFMQLPMQLSFLYMGGTSPLDLPSYDDKTVVLP